MGVVYSQPRGATPAAAPASTSSSSTSNQPVATVAPTHQTYNVQAPVTPQGSTVNLTLTVKELLVSIAPGVAYHAWTFNGTVPGPVLRVRQQDDELELMALIEGADLGYRANLPAATANQHADAWVDAETAGIPQREAPPQRRSYGRIDREHPIGGEMSDILRGLFAHIRLCWPSSALSMAVSVLG